MIEMLIKRLKMVEIDCKSQNQLSFWSISIKFNLFLISFDRFWTFWSNPDLNWSNLSRWLKIRLQIWIKYLIKIQFQFDYNRNTIPKSIQLPKLKKTSFKHNIGTNGLKAWEQLSSIRGVFVNQGPGEPQGLRNFKVPPNFLEYIFSNTIHLIFYKMVTNRLILKLTILA